MSAALQIVFWLSVAILAYTWAGYPLLAVLRARFLPRGIQRGPTQDAVSILIAAHDEEGRVGDKLRSILAARAQERIREILVGSDGSLDGTVREIGSAGDARIRAFDFTERRGKPAVLNDLAKAATSPILVMMDARQPIAEDALERILAPFADPSVGVVSGELVFRDLKDGCATSAGMDAYWRYEKLIRKSESAFGSVPGATGAFYAIRSSLFRPIAPDILLDDVLIPMQAVMQGGRCILEGGALCFDKPSRDLKAEAIRKRRTLAGNVQLLLRHPEWLLPGRGIAWQYVSHKVLRLFTPFLLVAAAIANALLVSQSMYAVLAIPHAAFYALALVGWVLHIAGRKTGMLGSAYMFVSLAWVTALGWGDALTGRTSGAWKRSGRVGS